MGIIKRILYGIIKRPFRAGSLAVIIMISIIGTLFGEYLNGILSSYQSFINQEIGYCIDLISKDDNISISDEMADKIGAIDSVIGYVSEESIVVTPVDFENYIPTEIINSDFDIMGDKNQVKIFGSTDTEYNSYFLQGQVKIDKGNFPSKNSNEVLIEKEFAEFNSLTIYDVIHIYDEYMEEQIELKIIGIYDMEGDVQNGTNIRSVGEIYGQTPYSHIFCDFNILSKINPQLSNKSMYSFYTEDSVGLNHIINHMDNMNLDKDIFEYFNRTEVAFTSLSTVMRVLRDSSQSLLLVINISIYLIILFMTFLWMRDHYHDAAIYIALGKNRMSIVWEYLIEVIIITIIALLLSNLISYTFLSNYGKRVIELLLHVQTKQIQYQSIDTMFISNHIKGEALVRSNIIIVMVVIGAIVLSGISILCYRTRNLFDIKN